jgi:hypothetical protein
MFEPKEPAVPLRTSNALDPIVHLPDYANPPLGAHSPALEEGAFQYRDSPKFGCLRLCRSTKT